MKKTHEFVLGYDDDAAETEAGINPKRSPSGLDTGSMVQWSVGYLQANEPKDGYIGAFSGGKDSCVIKKLASMAGVKTEWHYHVTTIDPPELVRFIKQHHPDVIWDRPACSMFKRAEQKGFPSRKARWCCDEYKERQFPGRSLILGIRIAESIKRARNYPDCRMYDRKRDQVKIMPIRLWLDRHVWEFLRWTNTPYCSLYDEGFTRLGCVGCPLTNGRIIAREFARWPIFKERWRKVFHVVWERRHGSTQIDSKPWFGDRMFDDADDMFAWWCAGQPNFSKWKYNKQFEQAVLLDDLQEQDAPVGYPGDDDQQDD